MIKYSCNTVIMGGLLAFSRLWFLNWLPSIHLKCFYTLLDPGLTHTAVYKKPNICQSDHVI